MALGLILANAPCATPDLLAIVSATAVVIGAFVGIVSYRTTKERMLLERIDTADASLRTQIHAQEVKCAEVSTGIATRLEALKETVDRCDGKLDELLERERDERD